MRQATLRTLSGAFSQWHQLISVYHGNTETLIALGTPIGAMGGLALAAVVRLARADPCLDFLGFAGTRNHPETMLNDEAVSMIAGPLNTIPDPWSGCRGRQYLKTSEFRSFCRTGSTPAPDSRRARRCQSAPRARDPNLRLDSCSLSGATFT